MGEHTEFGECLSLKAVAELLEETDKKCAAGFGLHFRFLVVEWVQERLRFVVTIRYTK